MERSLQQFPALESLPLTPGLKKLFHEFYESYLIAVQNGGMKKEQGDLLFKKFTELVAQQIKNPSKFGIFHQSVRTPFDYYQFGLDFIAPLIDFKESHVMRLKQVDRILDQIAKGENVVLLANHQTEPDPQIINLLLAQHAPKLGPKMIFVAGHRVVEDPVAIPMSLGCNLLCIYSKKHIDFPIEDKAKKVSHNQRTMKKMADLLKEGGKCIYVAPSGGRDRPNAHNEFDVAPFDAQSIEMFSLMAQKSGKSTHFYPLALLTYDLLPPPKHVEKELGERRLAYHTPVYLAFGEEVNMDFFPGSEEGDRKEKRVLRAHYIWNQVHEDYLKLREIKRSFSS